VRLISLSCGDIARVPSALGQYILQLQEMSLTIDLDASHYLHTTTTSPPSPLLLFHSDHRDNYTHECLCF